LSRVEFMTLKAPVQFEITCHVRWWDNKETTADGIKPDNTKTKVSQ